MKDINELREQIFDTIQKLKDGKIDVQKAKAISELAQVLVNSAKAEVDYLKQVGGVGTGFIEKGDPQIKMISRAKGEYQNNGHQKTIDKYSGQ